MINSGTVSKISQYYQPSASNQSEVYKLWDSILLISSALQCFQFLQNSLKILPCISLDGDPGLCPKAAPLFVLTAPLLFPHPPPFLISNSLNQLVGTQGRPWRLNGAYFLYIKSATYEPSSCELSKM